MFVYKIIRKSPSKMDYNPPNLIKSFEEDNENYY